MAAGGPDAWGCLRSAFPNIYDIAEDESSEFKRGGMYFLRGEGLVLGRNRISLACKDIPDEKKDERQRAFHGLWNRVHRCGRTPNGKLFGHVRIYREGVNVYVEAIGKNGCVVSPGGTLRRGERKKVGERAFIVLMSSRWCKNPLPGPNSEQIAFEYRTNGMVMGQLATKCEHQAEFPYLSILKDSEKKFIGERFFPTRAPYVRRTPPRWSAVVRALACGLHDPRAPVSKLRGQRDVWRKIWGYLQEFWREMVVREFPKKVQDPHLPYAIVSKKVRFPAPQGISVTMMPFVPVDKKSLPEKIAAYWPLIEACSLPAKDLQSVCYLTIRESKVKEGETQGPGGLRTACPGAMTRELAETTLMCEGLQSMGEGKWLGPRTRLGWGYRSRVNGGQVGGVYMASSMGDTIAVHACKIKLRRSQHDTGIIQAGGDVEHLRPLFPEGRTLQSSEMAWVTDTTPYECLPAPTAGVRQFFQVVTSQVDVWYSDRYTENPSVPPNAVVMTGNKRTGRLEIDYDRFSQISLVK
mmetsp:Transcript_11128/g.22112  ORF Transcript_11128/g.22112 Transcript_11128/m.22112 type:complete len:523 (-) Transcript_11128:155-1723(-)